MKIKNRKTRKQYEITGQVNTLIDYAVLPQEELNTLLLGDNAENLIFINCSFVDSDGNVFTTSFIEGEIENSEYKII